MRTYTSDDGTITINYPDGIIQVFNPHYIEVDGITEPFTIAVLNTSYDRRLQITPHDGKAKIYISRLMQLSFDKGEYAKYLPISIYKQTSGMPAVYFSFNTWALWGVRRIDDLSVLGGHPNRIGNQPQIVHKVVKFADTLPFTTELFFFDDTESAVAIVNEQSIATFNASDLGTGFVTLNKDDFNIPSGVKMIDLKLQWARPRYLSNKDIIRSIATNDLSYRTALRYLIGTTTAMSRHLDEVIRIEIRDEENGYYLRWRDRHGFLRYWLFVKGKTSEKVEMVDYSVEDENIVQGEYYQNQTRIASKNSQDTIEACAVHLDEYEIDYIRDIITSPEIDIFMGRNTGDEEIWQPVNVVSGTYTIEPNRNAKLQNYTIKFTLPVYESQHL